MRDSPLAGRDRLARDDQTIEVAGPPDAAVFPPICVNCGAASTATIRITKVFRRETEDPPVQYGVYGLHAPVCAQCAQLHRAELMPPDPAVKQKRLRRWYWEAAFPYALPVAAIVAIALILSPPLIPAITRHFGLPVVAGWAAVGTAFALLLLVFFAMFVASGRELIAPPSGTRSCWYAHVEGGPLGSRLILPTTPTSVATAVDFSDDCADLLDGERHRYTFRKAEVAARFAPANANRIWNPKSARARIASTARWILIGGLILLAAIAMVADVLGVRLPILSR